MKHSDILFLVTARSGSKGVPGKNIQPFGKIPALGLRIDVIKKFSTEAEIVCSTDSEEYACIATQFGARAPFLRPSELSSDKASSIDVILHALDWLQEHERKKFKHLVLIEPSSPFCRVQDIAAGMKMLREFECPVVAVRAADVDPIFIAPLGMAGEFPDLGSRLNARSQLQRQAFEKQFTPCGIFYGVPIEILRSARTFYTHQTRAFSVPEEYGLEIDSPLQADLAKVLWESGRIQLY